MKKIGKIIGIFVGEDGKKKEVDLNKLPKVNRYKADMVAVEEGRKHRKRLREAFEEGDERKMRLMQNKVVIKKR